MIHVTVYKNPLSAENERSEIEHGKSFRDILDTLDLGRNALVVCDGARVPVDQWDMIPRDDSFVIMRYVPGTTGEAGNGFADFLVDTITSGVEWALDLVDSSIHETYRSIAALFKEAKTSGDTSVESRPGISGASNSANPYGPIPVILGTHYIAPFYAGLPYTEISGTDGVDQYIHLSFKIAYGPLSVGSIRLGENLLATNTADVRTGEITVDGNYNPDDIDIEIRQDANAMTHYPYRVTEAQSSIEMRAPAGVPTYLYATSAPGAIKLEVDFECPNGINAYDSEGNEVGTDLEFKADYRVAGSGGAWTNFYDGVFTDKKLKATGRYTGTKTGLTAGSYEVRAYRVTADNTSDLVRDDVYWTALRSTLDMPPVLPAISAKTVRISMRVKASTAVSGSLNKVNLIASSIIPVYDGSGTGSDDWASTAITANPAAQALYVLRGAANPKPVIDANIDWPAFEALYAWCETLVDDGESGTEKRNQCNALIDSQDKGIDVANKILLTCRASVTRYGNIISVIHDTVKTVPVGLITARNCYDYMGSKAFADVPHGYRIRFVNAAANYQEDECIVLRDGYVYDTYNDGTTRDAFGTPHTTAEYYEGTTYYILATELESIERWGITNHSMLWREGRYELAKLILRSEVHSVKQSVEAISYTRGSLVRLGHDVPLFGVNGGEIKYVTLDGSSQATAFVGDELLPMETGKAYGIRYQRVSDGRVLWADLTAVVGTDYGYSFSTAIAAADVPAVGDQFWFGEVVDGTPNDTAEEIVVGIEPGENLTYTIYLQDYAPGVHTADTGTIPDYESHLTLPVARNFGVTMANRTASQQAATQAIQSQVTAIAAAAANTTTQATKYDVTSSVSGFTKSRQGVVSPASVTFAGFSIIAGIQSAYDGRFKIYESADGTTWGAAAYTSSDDESSKAYSTITAKIAAIRCELYAAGGVTVLLDTITIPVAYNESTAPQYLGIGILAGASTMAFTGATVDADGEITAGSSVADIIANDWMVNYDATYLAIGIYGWSGTAWAISETAAHIDAAQLDIMHLAKGTPSITLGACTVLVNAIVDRVFAQYLKVANTLRVGDRYDEDGTTIDATKDGIFFDGATGRGKVAGLDFEGSQGGGVQWGGFAQVGSGLSIPSIYIPSLCALNGTDVAFIDSNWTSLRVYRWDGSVFAQVGSGLTISGVAYPALTLMAPNDVAFIDYGLKSLRVYRWDGSVFAQVGSGLSISGIGASVSLCALNSTDVAFIDATLDSLRVYRWDGSVFAQVGSGLTISGIGGVSLCALNGTDVAFIDSTLESLRVYRWNGSVFAQVGSGLSIPGVSGVSLCALNGTDVAFIDATLDLLQIYRWNGSVFSQVGSAGSAHISGGTPALVAISGSEVVLIDDATETLRKYRLSFALSDPYSLKTLSEYSEPLGALPSGVVPSIGTVGVPYGPVFCGPIHQSGIAIGSTDVAIGTPNHALLVMVRRTDTGASEWDVLGGDGGSTALFGVSGASYTYTSGQWYVKNTTANCVANYIEV